MKIPDKVKSLSIWIHSDIKGKSNVDRIFVGLKSAVNREFGKQGYDVSDAFKLGSDQNYNGRFCIIVSPQKENGDSCIDIIDDDLAKQNSEPTLETITIGMIEAIRNRQGLPYAFVYHSDIPGLDFLDSHTVKDDIKAYVLKNDLTELNLL